MAADCTKILLVVSFNDVAFDAPLRVLLSVAHDFHDELTAQHKLLSALLRLREESKNLPLLHEESL